MSLTTSFRVFMLCIYRQVLVGSNKCALLSQKGLFALLTLFTDAEGDSQSIQFPLGQHQKLFFSPSQIVTSAR